jgi:hypothetical protein
LRNCEALGRELARTARGVTAGPRRQAAQS